jgi:hypothetical protein
MAEMAEYISDNRQFIVNGFVRSGITGALDGIMQDEDDAEIDPVEHETDSEQDSACDELDD